MATHYLFCLGLWSVSTLNVFAQEVGPYYPHGWKDPSQSAKERHSELAACVFDGLQAASFLANAGTAIDAAIPACESPPGNQDRTLSQKAACASAASGAIQTLLNAAALIQAATSNCDPWWPNYGALCGADVTRIVTTLAEITQGAAGTINHCPSGGRRLESANETVPARRLLDTSELAACIVSNIQGTFNLGRLGLILESFSRVCQPGPNWEASCAAATLGLISNFGYTASFIAAAASQCAEGGNRVAACAADITLITGAAAGLGSALSSVTLTCKPENIKKHWQKEEQKHANQHRMEMNEALTKELDSLASKGNVLASHTNAQKSILSRVPPSQEPLYHPLHYKDASQKLTASLNSLSGRTGGTMVV